MRHEFTIICDDIRQEVGRKVSIMGIYDVAIIVKKVPTRLPKLCMFQRWIGSDQPERVRVEVRGSALSSGLMAEAERDREHYDPSATRANLSIALAPLDIANTGEIEFVTHLSEHGEPPHSHKIEIRLDRGISD
jgi:hypothetical protein